MPTWLDLADDAIKIGFGAIIGATGSIGIAVYNRRKEVAAQYSKRRNELLLRIGSEFATSSHQTDILLIDLITFASLPENSSQEQRLKASINEGLKTSKPASENSFFILMSLARIANYPEIAEAIHDLTKTLNTAYSSILEAVRRKTPTGFAPGDSQEKLDQLLNNKYIASQRVISLIAKAFEST